VSFEILEDATAVRETVALALQFKRQRYPKTAPSGAYEDFYYRMSQSTFDSGRPHISRLRVGKEVVAVHVGAVNGSRFYYLLPGYDVRWSRYSVGRLLLQELVRWCILERLATFDMTVGREHYKRFWTDTLLPLHSCRYGVTSKGSAAMALVRAFDYTLVRPYALAKQNPKIRRTLLPVKHRLLAMKRDMQRRR
jgi:CelD/BcsL family acetyltransferase involved in cellulose biosynthesis